MADVNRLLRVDLKQDEEEEDAKEEKIETIKRSQIKSRGKRRLARVVNVGRLVGTLGEYLASRNVISWPESGELRPSSGSGYERVGPGGSPPERALQSAARRSKLKPISELRKTTFDEFQWTSDQRQPVKWNSKQTQLDSRHHCSCCERFCCCWPVAHGLAGGQATCASKKNKKKRGSNNRTRQLLAALLSGSQDTTRVRLVYRLLRAPIVLAALFSLALVASILVLYTLSFHDHHFGTFIGPRDHQDDNNRQQHHHRHQHLGQLPSGLAGGKQHHINSRQLQPPEEATGSSGARVRTECATYEGVAEARARIFKGIPYASAPIGPRRWARPRPIWLDSEHCGQPDAVKSATQFRSHCLQVSPFTRQVSGREDCLYLDIFAPIQNSTKLIPVMVYIHGGFLAYGSSGQGQVNWMGARPSGQLASELNVVLVALNYRLQALGFMALEQLAESNDDDWPADGRRGAPARNNTTNSSGPLGAGGGRASLGSATIEGNYGLWDQLVALNWIRRNIESFGGSPENIVLFGPDSASSLPFALVAGGGGPLGGGGGAVQRGAQSLPQANEPPMAPAEATGASTSGGPPSSIDGQVMDENLFRAAWLTNPSVYYELAPQLANKHYERLIESQSICSSAAAAAAKLPRTSSHTMSASLNDNRRLGANKSAPLVDCLLALRGEQVVREYLGRDDPAFRLDDQSSLPIKNIFPDQFVTVDGLLVRDSFPFNKWPGRQPAPDGRQNGTHDISGHSLNANDNFADDQLKQATPKRLLIGSSAQAVEYWPCPRDLYHWRWEDFRRYVGTSLNSFTQETYRQASEMYQVPPVDDDTDNDTGHPLTDSRGNQTNRSPVETYLSMVSDIKQICPINELAKSWRQSKRRPKVERYIVEWRPSAQLSASLKQPGNNCGAELAGQDNISQKPTERQTKSHEQQHKPRFAFHYWDLMAFFGFEFDSNVEPNEMDLRFQREIRKMVKEFVWNDYYEEEQRQQERTQKLRHQLERKEETNHYEEANGGQQNDLNGGGGQDERESHSISGIHDNENMIPLSKLSHEHEALDGAGSRGGHDEDVNDDRDGFILFALDGLKRRVVEFRQNECKMWSKFLKQSYAWVS